MRNGRTRNHFSVCFTRYRCGHLAGLHAVQTQSYGSEARGGQCQAELIIDREPILSPVAQKKDLLLAMFSEAYHKYIHDLKEDGVLVYDTDLVQPSRAREKVTECRQHRWLWVSAIEWPPTW
jgi:Pyruvate/2-oxoacid:ferredoxin oxidoreductase gamma subunit